ncbi:hypothetical protein [Domibacillus indicus]|uniref:hypothetical protein n=1 Tax=Domibacillus indicus TaxID=1437523 RepID=UPI000618006E|nr:hypothetical protein [Domibacillus indicus]
MTAASLHKRELAAILGGFPGFIEQHADQHKLEQLYRTWIPLLSTYVTHDAVEAAIDEWHAMLQDYSLWLHYIEEQLALTVKPVIQNILEQWKQPFVFAGSRTAENTFTGWSNGNKLRIQSEYTHVIGLALPMEANSALLVHFFETEEEFEELLDEGFSQAAGLTKQDYLNTHYLTCLSFLSDNS